MIKRNFNKLVSIIMLVYTKYFNDVTLIIRKNTLIIEVDTYIYGDRDVYKMFEITEYEQKYKVKIRENDKNVIKLLNFKEVDNLIKQIVEEEKKNRP